MTMTMTTQSHRPHRFESSRSLVISSILFLFLFVASTVSSASPSSSSSLASGEQLLHRQLHAVRDTADDEVTDSYCTGDALKQSTCSGMVQRLIASRNYFDVNNCSALHYAPGCAAGFYTLPKTQRSADTNETRSCCPGFYCPEGTVCLVPCSQGGYCPSPSTRGEGSSSWLCSPYSSFWRPGLGCGGADRDFPCPEGYYCSSPDQPAVFCPSGYYCPSGSNEPQKCPILAHCPLGSVVPQLNFLGVAIIIIASLIIIFSVMLGRHIKANQFKNFYKAWSEHQLPNNWQSSTDVEQASSHEEEMVEIVQSNGIAPIEFKVDIRVEDFGYSIGKLRILNAINGTMKAGRMTAIMGPSGAGKTSFLLAISGKMTRGTITGKIFVNEFEESISKYKDIVGFVPQDDIMHRTLTVFENLAFNAKWRLPASMPLEEKMHRVFKVMQVLGLNKPELSNRLIGDSSSNGSISGGERKRVNIGMELVANPSVLFLDEPTSGLDSSTTFEVLDALRRVASSGVNVIVVLHQPRYEVMDMFDDLLLIAPGGRTAYMGPKAEALNYFLSKGFELPQFMNPADFYMDIVSGRLPPSTRSDELEESGKEDEEREQATEEEEEEEEVAVSRSESLLNGNNSSSSSSSTTTTNDNGSRSNTNGKKEKRIRYVLSLWDDEKDRPQSVEREEFLSSSHDPDYYIRRKQASFWHQTYYCITRSLTQRSRELDVIFSSSVLMSIAGLVLGLLFRGVAITRVPNVNLFISMSIGFAATQSALRLFGEERVVFWREAGTGLNRIAYFIGKDISYLTEIILLPFFFLSLFYFLAGPRASFSSYYFILLANQYSLAGIGQLISVVMSPTKAQLAGVVVTLILNAISGFTPNMREMGNFSFVCSLSYARWLLEALWLIESSEFPDIFRQQKEDISAKFSYVMGNAELREHQLLYCVGVIVLQGVIARVLTCISFYIFNRDKQR